MPIEKQPVSPVPPDHVPTRWRALYKVRDNDTWESVARQWRVDVGRLIRHNFNLPEGVPYNPAEVNWYLRHRVGCKLPTADGKNWRFSSAADPGWIFIPLVSEQFPWGRCASSVVQPHSQFVLSADGVQIPLPHGRVSPGAKIAIWRSRPRLCRPDRQSQGLCQQVPSSRHDRWRRRRERDRKARGETSRNACVCPTSGRIYWLTNRCRDLRHLRPEQHGKRQREPGPAVAGRSARPLRLLRLRRGLVNAVRRSACSNRYVAMCSRHSGSSFRGLFTAC